LKIQISNFYNLSIILFILSGCQELRDLNIGDQILLDIIETKEINIITEKIKTENLDTTSVEPEKKDSLKTKNNLQVDYSYLSRFKIKIGSLIYLRFDTEDKKIKNILLNNYRKPKFKVNFNISKTLYALALQKKHLYYKDSFFQSLISNNSVLFNIKVLNSITYSELINLLSDPDYIRKQSQILTLQYRLNECVIDFYFKENTETLILYDMRERRYGESFFKEDCILELNLRLIHNS
tara:strand:- start:116 stop:829 length:714 start_codon:yes stop_codon:yes gene_type:complete